MHASDCISSAHSFHHPDSFVPQIAAGERVPLAPIVNGGDIASTVHAALQACRDCDRAAASDVSPLGHDSGAAECAELVLVCGSFYILADVRRAIGLCDEIDAFDLHERMHTAPTATAAASASEAASSVQ